MKLVEIKDVRVGQIWQSKTDHLIKVVIYDKDQDEKSIKDNGNLIGFLNITHKIENDRLVEIPRDEIEVDDVVSYEFSDGENRIDIVKSIGFYVSLIYFDKGLINKKCLNKIGIYGVTHEFVNERLVK